VQEALATWVHVRNGNVMLAGRHGHGGCRSASTVPWALAAQRPNATRCEHTTRQWRSITCCWGRPKNRTASMGRSHLVFSKISRPISMRRISLVPAPIS
jgi:hypothetical protein